jgi:hypothetical protein
LKAWVYVEGPSDVAALNALWSRWRNRLRQAGHGIELVHLVDKATFFRKLGRRAAKTLKESPQHLVVGLPDLYPNEPYVATPHRHANLEELKTVQRRLVGQAVREWPGVDSSSVPELLSRFFPAALKYDLEMLLLAARPELRIVLNTRDKLGDWRLPVEDQDQGRPPKQVIEELFLSKSPEHRRYRDTRDAPNVLRRVSDIRTLLYTDAGQVNCPTFKATLDWLGERFGVPAYD